MLCLSFGMATAFYILSPLDQELKTGIAIFMFIAILWMTEAIHVTATALLVPVLAIASGLLTSKEAFANFAHPIIFLFLSGFALATALHKHKLDLYLTHLIIRKARGNSTLVLLLIFLSTAFTSMWISNTATTLMFLPIALGILNSSTDKDKDNKHLSWFILLGVAYSANIGGMGSLVGSPPNAIAASHLGLSFSDWFKYGVPAVLIMLPLTIFILWFVFRPKLPKKFNFNTEEIVWNKQTFLTFIVFIVTIFCWLSSKSIADFMGINVSIDSWIGCIALLVLITLGLLEWSDIEKNTNWGVLLLFGGGLTLSTLLAKTGSTTYIASQLTDIVTLVGPLIFLLICMTLMVFLTEVSSNTASAALMIPLFYALPGESLGINPFALAIGVSLAASCAFMLPVATPPNAIVFATGKVPQKQMMRVGLILNLVTVFVLSLLSREYINLIVP